MDADAVRRAWSNRSGEFSPDYYAYYGANGTSELVRRWLDETCGPDAGVLELGCSAGRHLAHLHEHGYDDLQGVDVNDEAMTVLAQSYPALAETGSFVVDAIENVIRGFDDGQFDAVFSVETLQHLHPESAWVYEEIARVTADVLVTVEVEAPTADRPRDGRSVNYVADGVPLYYRDWRDVFEPLGFEHVEAVGLDGDEARLFRRRRRA